MTSRIGKETERTEGDCKENKWRKNNRKHDMEEGDGGKVTVEKEGGTRGQEMRDVDATGGKMKGRKEMRVDVTKRKSITRMISGKKEAGKKGTTEKAAGGKVSNQGDAKRRSYSGAVIEGALRTERVFMGDSILRKTNRN